MDKEMEFGLRDEDTGRAFCGYIQKILNDLRQPSLMNSKMRRQYESTRLDLQDTLQCLEFPSAIVKQPSRLLCSRRPRHLWELDRGLRTT